MTAHAKETLKNPTAEGVLKLVQDMVSLKKADMKLVRDAIGAKGGTTKSDLAQKIHEKVFQSASPQSGERKAASSVAAPAAPDKSAVLNTLQSAHAELAKEADRAGGIVKVPDLVDKIKKAHPDLSTEQVHGMMKEMHADGSIILQKLNMQASEPRASEGIQTPGGTGFYVKVTGEKPAALTPKADIVPTVQNPGKDFALPNEKKLFDDFKAASQAVTRDGLTPLGEVFDHMQKKNPNLTVEDFHKQLLAWKGRDMVSLTLNNDPRVLTPEARSKSVVDSERPGTAYSWVRGKPGEYAAPKGEEKPTAPAEKPKQAAQATPKAQEAMERAKRNAAAGHDPIQSLHSELSRMDNPADRQAIENALEKMGAKKIGARGETTKMDGGSHESKDAVFPGDDVDVVHPGFLDPRNNTLLGKATVKARGKQAAFALADHHATVASALEKHGQTQDKLTSLVDLRKEMSHLPRDQQDAVIKDMQKSGKISLVGLEGRQGISQAERDASIPHPDGPSQPSTGYVKLRDQGTAPAVKPTATASNAAKDIADTYGKAASLSNEDVEALKPKLAAMGKEDLVSAAEAIGIKGTKNWSQTKLRDEIHARVKGRLGATQRARLIDRAPEEPTS